MRQTIAGIFFLLVAIAPHPALGWGQKGHRVVASIAENHVTAETGRKIHELLGNDNLAAIAVWADQVRSQRDETHGWHSVDIPRGSETFSRKRDCFRPEGTHKNAANDHHNCVVDRIAVFRDVLASVNKPKQERLEALRFLVHFVGDIHNPLHAIGDERGGNGVRVTEFGQTICGRGNCNLHQTWDDGLIEHRGLAEEQYVEKVEQLIRDKHLKASGKIEGWANESHRCAKAAWVDSGASIDEGYYNKNIEMLDERLALAGLRLARLLDEALAGKPAPH